MFICAIEKNRLAYILQVHSFGVCVFLLQFSQTKMILVQPVINVFMSFVSFLFSAARFILRKRHVTPYMTPNGKVKRTEH